MSDERTLGKARPRNAGPGDDGRARRAPPAAPRRAASAPREEASRRAAPPGASAESALAIAAENGSGRAAARERDAAGPLAVRTTRQPAGETAAATPVEAEAAALRAAIAAQRWEIQGLKEQLAKALGEGAAAVEERRRAAQSHAAEMLALRQRREETAAALGAAEGLAQTYKILLENLRHAVFSGLWTAFNRPAAGAELFRTILAIWQSGLFDESYYRSQCRDGEIAQGMPAVVHYVLSGEAGFRDPHPLFQVGYYRARLPAPEEPANALLHYLERGHHLPPNPLFDPEYYLERHPELARAGINPLVHYVLVGAAADCDPHPLFDSAHYRAGIAAQGGEPPRDPLAHYLRGPQRAISPHPLFDARFYLAAHPEVAARPVPPLVHFLDEGDRLGWSPHPWFDTAYYRRANPDVAASGDNALVHFVRHGGAEGRAPHPAFDAAFYRAQNPDVAEGEPGWRTLAHFLRHGVAEGRSPHPLVDLDYIREQLPGQSLGAAGLLRLLRARKAVIRRMSPPDEPVGERQFTPHRMFDPAYYTGRAPQAANAPDGPFLFYLSEGWQGDEGPHPLFDPAYYRLQAAARGLALRDPLAHFIAEGNALGLAPHPLFDPAYYLKMNPDVAADRVDPLEHYLSHGDFEGRDPNPLFSLPYYRTRAELRRSEHALLHYIAKGGAIDPHELFDTRYYLSRLAEPPPAGRTPLAHYLGFPEGRGVSPFPLFDPDHVRAQLAAEGAGDAPLLSRYLEQPPEEAPAPHPAFDRDYFHDTVGYREPGLLEYVGTWRRLGHGGYQLHKLHYHEANRDFCSISYLLDHPELLDGGDIPLVHHVRHAGWPERADAPPGPPPAEEGDLAAFYRPAPCAAGALREAAADQRARGLKHLARNDPFFLAPAADRDAGLAALWEGTTPHATLAGDERELLRKVRQSRRIAIYALYAPDGRLKAYHRAMLAALAEAGYPAILVNSTTAGAATLAEEVAASAAGVVVRRGGGRDFASWIIALAHFAPALCQADHVLLLNDSLIGPFGDLSSVLAALERHPADFKGLTESLDVIPHLQSSCLLLSRHALFSGAFLQFVADFALAVASGIVAAQLPGSDGPARPSVRHVVVRAGELRLSTQLMSAGVGSAALAPYRPLAQAWLDRVPQQVERAYALPARLAETGLDRLMPAETAVRLADYLVEWLLERAVRMRAGERVNPQHFFWDALLTGSAFPFIKKDLLLTNPAHIPTVVGLRDLLPAERRAEYGALLRDLVPPRPQALPPAYFRLSGPLLDGLLQ